MLVDAFGATKKHNIMQDTWGHLYPTPGKKYPGKILISSGVLGGQILLDYKFEGVDDSPVTFALICSSLELYDLPQGIYQLDCTLWFFKSSSNMFLGDKVGKIIKCKLKTLQDLSGWAKL